MTLLTDKIVKLVTLLQDNSIPNERKDIAAKELHEIRYRVTRQKYGVSDDRVDDVMQLESIIDDPATPPNYRVVAQKSLKKILGEDKNVKSMRKRLIKEMISGNSENVRDITDYVGKHSKYQ